MHVEDDILTLEELCRRLVSSVPGTHEWHQTVNMILAEFLKSELERLKGK